MGLWGLGFFFSSFLKAELFLYVRAQFPIGGTADFSSKMGLGKVAQRKKLVFICWHCAFTECEHLESFETKFSFFIEK